MKEKDEWNTRRIQKIVDGIEHDESIIMDLNESQGWINEALDDYTENELD
jgi:hypothetical protein